MLNTGRRINIITLSFVFLCISFQMPKRDVTYRRFTDNKPGNGTICLKKDGTFSAQIFGGCDGQLESRGKWKLNKDTLNLMNAESRMMNDPWKRSEGESKFLMKKGTLTSFSIVDGKMVLDENAFYKKK